MTKQNVEAKIRLCEELLAKVRSDAPKSLVEIFDFAIKQAQDQGQNMSAREVYQIRLESEVSILKGLLAVLITTSKPTFEVMEKFLADKAGLVALTTLMLLKRVDNAEAKIAALQAKLAMHGLEVPNAVS